MSANQTNWTQFVEEFCGSEFWPNKTYYENSTFPNFTPCFQYTVLVGVPALFMLLLAPILTFQLEWLTIRRRDILPLPYTFLSSLKCFLTLIMFLSSLLLFFRYFASWELAEGQVFFWYPLVRTLTSAHLHHTQRRIQRLGYPSNGILFCATLLLLVCSLSEARSWVERVIEHRLVKPYDLWNCILFGVWFVALSIYMLSQFFVEARSPQETQNILARPEFTCSFPSRITLSWFGPLMLRSGKRRIARGELFRVDRLAEALPLYKTWNSFWLPKIRGYHPSHSSTPSILSTLFAMFRWELVAAGWLRLVGDLLQFAAPISLFLFMEYLERTNERLWKGVSLAIALFVALQTRALIQNYESLVAHQVGIKVQSTLNAVLYKKSLRLSIPHLDSQSTTKNLQKLISEDTEAVRLLFTHIHSFWSPLLQISLAFLGLYLLLEVAALPVMIFVLMLALANLCTLVDESDRFWELKRRRLALTSQMLRSFETIKLYVWESPLQALIGQLVADEWRAKRCTDFVNHLADASALFAPHLMTLFSVLLYVVMEDKITSPKHVFVALMLLYQLCRPINQLRSAILSSHRAFQADQRLKEHILADQIDQKSNANSPTTTEQIHMENASFALAQKTLFSDVNLRVPGGSLVAVVGEEGDRRTNFLHALLGELHKSGGEARNIRGPVGYVPKKPWLNAGSVRQNIQLGVERPMQPPFFGRLVEKLELEALLEGRSSPTVEIEDLDRILTESQKVCVALARAAYHDPQIYLLDQTLDLLDRPISQRVFQEFTNSGGMFAEKTRFIATNNVEAMRTADLVVYVDGQNIKSGSFDQLSTSDPSFDQFVHHTDSSQNRVEFNTPLPPTIPHLPTASTEPPTTARRIRRVTWDSQIRQEVDAAPLDSAAEDQSLIDANDDDDDEPLRHVLSFYWHFFRRLAVELVICSFCALSLLLVSLQLIQSVWLADWMNRDWRMRASPLDFPFVVRVVVFGVIGLLEVAIFILIVDRLTVASARLHEKIHGRLLDRILSTPCSFFDTPAIGKLVELLNRQLEAFEFTIPSALSFLTFTSAYIFVGLLISVIFTPILLIWMVLFATLLIFVMYLYIRTSRQLHKMALQTQKPILEHISQTSQGAITIRALGHSRDFAWKNDDLVDRSARIMENQVFADHWIAIRFSTITNYFILATFLSIIFLHYRGFGLSDSWIGLSLAYILNLPFFMHLFVERLRHLCTHTIPTKRLREIEELAPERQWPMSANPPPAGWPDRGVVRFERLSTYQHPVMDLFVQNLDVELRAAQKVAVIGRDSSGRGALKAALFRLADPAAGRVLIDGVDINEFGVAEIRQRLAILPADPLIFHSESIRFNLDPEGRRSDADLWTALKAVHLDALITAMWSDALEHRVGQGDLTLQERWLLSLARAILKPSRILVMDEPTTAIEDVTQALIHEIVRREFADSTVLAISRDFSPTLHSDMWVMLLESGEMTRLDQAHVLLGEVGPSSPS